MKTDYYTYAYLRKNKTPYYIGKGRNRRAYQKHDYFFPPSKDRIIFLKRNLTEEDAFKHEKYMIAVFGRIDLGTGILRNKTDGGDSPPIFRGHTEESKQKIRDSCKGRVLGPGMSEEARKRISKYNKEMGIKPPLFEKEFSFTSPDGIVYSGKNITKFAREHNLNPDALLSLRSYKQYSHRGWTLTNSCKIRLKRPLRSWDRPNYGKEYCLESPDGEYHYIIVGEMRPFAEENNLLSGGLSKLINEKLKTYKGWKVVK